MISRPAVSSIAASVRRRLAHSAAVLKEARDIFDTAGQAEAGCGGDLSSLIIYNFLYCLRMVIASPFNLIAMRSGLSTDTHCLIFISLFIIAWPQ